MGYPAIVAMIVAMIAGTVIGRVGMQQVRWRHGYRRALGLAITGAGFALVVLACLEPHLHIFQTYAGQFQGR